MSTNWTRAAAWTAAVLAGTVLVAVAVGAGTPIVATAHNARLKGTILVNRSGHTLYNLSVERKGRFICTDRACLALWHPLTVAKGTRPVGRVPLGTVKRPDGRIQVTYRGAPLYSFSQDVKRGDTRGEGFRDVGVWHATTVRASTTTPPPPPPTTTSGDYGY
jgi:predicted lipoprotein with Yx(FWY)xxD motif